MIRIKAERGLLLTEGLASLGMEEIGLSVGESTLMQEAHSLLDYVAGYVARRGAGLRDGETIGYGYWLLRLRSCARGLLELQEYAEEGDGFVDGADLALRYWQDQHSVCKRLGAQFSPPRPDSLAAISDGVYEGKAVQGVRYPGPEHMSGWWVTSDAYDGCVSSLRTVHMFHLTARRPELAAYVALPCGYRFDFSEKEDVWFDEDVAGDCHVTGASGEQRC